MSTSPSPRLVVGVGASAGGLEAFKRLLAVLPADSGMSFLLVQHLDPHHDSLLSELLTPLTEMSVRDVQHGQPLEPDTVYIIRPDTSLAVRGGRIELSPPTLHRGARLSVDHLFRSLAREYGPDAVGIVLSGAGSDGSAGVRDIKAAGGLVLAQEPRSSGQDGMPRSAIATDVVDLVLDISEIPDALQRFAAIPVARRLPVAQEEAGDELKAAAIAPVAPSLGKRALGKITAVLEARADFDLRVYKAATVERRVLRRMALSGFDVFEPYLEQLRGDQAEQQKLVRDLLISVTEFFRDPASFRALRDLVLDPLMARAEEGQGLRVWVPACATGEEAYSIAMELLEAAEAHNKRIRLQVFATDLDQDALAVARAGVYPTTIGEQVSDRHLEKYFRALGSEGFQVRLPLRDVVSFAAHDLTKDPPFSRMSLVSCRNLLIYLTPEVQKRVLNTLHFALEADGHLMLSTSESTGLQRSLFSTLSKSQSIYRKVGASRPMPLAGHRSHPPDSEPPREAASGSAQGGGDRARRAVLDALAPPTLVVSDDGTIVFSHGELSPYIRIPEGDDPRFELGSVLRPHIATRVRGALYKCRREKAAHTVMSTPDRGAARVRITARPAISLGDDTVILTFEEAAPEAALPAQALSADGGEEAIVEQLEKELQATREDLRSTVEELETSNEELRSANEESMSMNEELQSANEELEATSEELRSLNEELTTMNVQLREKIEQTHEAHDDLNNFFSSTKVATVFLDEELRIKRFTPAAGELLAIDHNDNGRFIGDIARELLQHGLEASAHKVLDHLSPVTEELDAPDGRCLTRSVLPYRTESRRIEGVVVTFMDVTDLRRSNIQLSETARRLELAWEVAQGGVFEHRLPVDSSPHVSEAWTRVFGYRRDELPAAGQMLVWLSEQIHPEDRERYEAAYRELFQGGHDRCVLEVRLRHKAGHWFWGRKIAQVLERDEQGSARHVLRMLFDITDLKTVEASLRESEARFREMVDGLPLMVWVHDEAGSQELVNETFCEFFGVTGESMRGGRWQMLVHPDDDEAYTREFLRATAERRPFHAAARVRHADGSWRWVESWGRPRYGPDGAFRGFVGTSADITARLEMESALRTSQQAESQQRRFLETLLDNASVCVAVLEGEELRFIRVNRACQSLRPEVSMRGRSFAEVFPEAAALGIEDDLRRVRRTGEGREVYGYHAPLPARPDARWDYQIAALSGEESRGVMLLTIRDATDQYRAQEAVRASEMRLRALVEASSEVLYRVSPDWSEMHQLSGSGFLSEAEGGVPDWFQRCIPADEQARVRATIDAVIRERSVFQLEHRVLRVDGGVGWIFSRAVPLLDGEGEVHEWFGAASDITERKGVEETLRLEQARKDEFIATLGHELRNPLASITAASDLLEHRAASDPDIMSLQQILARQAAHMAKLLDGLLDISRIARGQIDFQREVTDFGALVSEVISDLLKTLDPRDLDILADVPPEPVWVLADPVRLAQIVSNLVANAMHHTGDGGSIRVMLDRGDAVASLVVRDSGVGISPETIPFVFDIFWRGPERSHGGLGLGLALVKTLVALHGGEVEASSGGPGQGAEFVVKLPRAPAPPPGGKGEATGGDAPGQRIVLIEDNEDAAWALKMLLEASGHEVTVANRGQQGLAEARRVHPAVVICDLGLPDGVSGFDVAETLRADENLADIRLIALSGYGSPEDKQRALEAGFDAHVTKPVDAMQLSQILTPPRP